jgi:hypothetical protein
VKGNMNGNKIVSLDEPKEENRIAEELTHPVNRMLKEAKSLEDRWCKAVESLKDIKDDYKRSCVCLLLENQRLMNEVVSGDTADNEMKKKLIQLVREVFPDLLAWNLISIQPLLGPAGLIYHLCRKTSEEGSPVLCVESEEVCARTRKFNRRVCKDFGPKDLSLGLIDELDTEFLNDLWNNCATVGCVNLTPYKGDKAVRLGESLKNMLELNDDFGKPNWIVANDKIYNRFKSAFDDLDLSFNGSIYPHKGVKGVLFGRKGESYMDTGYVYSPYVPFTLTPLLEGTSGFGLLTRYGKKLMRNGASHYRKMTIIDDTLEEGV